MMHLSFATPAPQAVLARPVSAMRKGLYLVTPGWRDTERLLAYTKAALRGGVVMVQYRNKTADQQLRLEQAGLLQTLCRNYRVPFLVNDSVKLCMQLDADGVHIDNPGFAIAQVREVLGGEKIIGVHCFGSLAFARQACDIRASYVSLGGFFRARAVEYETESPIELVSQVKAAIPLPVVVIGGISPAKAGPLIGQGADMVAATSGIYMSRDPELAARVYSGLFLPDRTVSRSWKHMKHFRQSASG